jgi:hypothetical protein
VNDLRKRVEKALGRGYAVERELSGGASSRLAASFAALAGFRRRRS